MRTFWTFILLGTLFVSSFSAHASGLRCGTDLISDGSSKAEVLLTCGEPMTKESRDEVSSYAVKERVGDVLEIREHTVVVKIDEWTYNLGPHQFLRTVIFTNGKVKDIVSGKYGK